MDEIKAKMEEISTAICVIVFGRSRNSALPWPCTLPLTLSFAIMLVDALALDLSPPRAPLLP
jgi:hypothetical protein